MIQTHQSNTKPKRQIQQISARTHVRFTVNIIRITHCPARYGRSMNGIEEERVDTQGQQKDCVARRVEKGSNLRRITPLHQYKHAC